MRRTLAVIALAIIATTSSASAELEARIKVCEGDTLGAIARR